MDSKDIDVKFPIVKSIKTKGYKAMLAYVILSAIAILVMSMLSFEEVPPIIRYAKVFLVVSSLIVWIFGNVIVKKFVEAGYLVISNDSIEIVQQDNEAVFKIDSITNLRFIISGYEGAPPSNPFIRTGLFHVKDGKNLLYFEYQGNRYQHNFFIQNRKQQNALKIKVDYLISEGYKIEI